MEDSRQTSALSDEEIQERIRARKARNKWGGVFAVIGIVGFTVSALALLLGLLFYHREITAAALGILGMFFGMAAVGAGFTDPSELKAFWK